jgi:CRISPR system Cascade subunit CasD
MRDYLTFTLYAPLASFGAPAVGERRGTFDRPTRSAILGLIGACLGIERDDEDGAQAALANQYRLAVLGLASGTQLADYHTAQMPSAKRGRRFATRREELVAGDLNTVLSRRDYRTDTFHIVALWIEGDSRWPLQALEHAMRHPRFTPYLGRKSCPLGLPLGPRIVAAEDVLAALRIRLSDTDEAHLRGDLGLAQRGNLVALDAAEAERLRAGGRIGSDQLRRVEQRRDQPLSRARWQFDLRAEALVAMP